MNTEPTTDEQRASVAVRRLVRYWAVTVAVDGAEILTIESECLSGIENVSEYRKEIIEAAENLLAFIGTGEESGFDFEDMPNTHPRALTAGRVIYARSEK
jgi:hypothetical protein